MEHCTFLRHALSGGAPTNCHESCGLGPTLAKEDAGALFPGPLGQANPGACHQHGPTHGLVPARRRVHKAQRDAIDGGFRFQSASGVFPHRHGSAIERREGGHRERVFVDGSNLVDARGEARPFGVFGNKPCRTAGSHDTSGLASPKFPYIFRIASERLSFFPAFLALVFSLKNNSCVLYDTARHLSFVNFYLMFQ